MRWRSPAARTPSSAPSSDCSTTPRRWRRWCARSEREAAALPKGARAALRRFVADDDVYYNTRYGSPLSYARALDLLAEAGVTLGPGARLLDFGYGYIGHLRLLALLGVDATGVDVDPMLRALYSEPGDTGTVGTGRVRVLDGRFPAEPAIIDAVGGDYDLVISKNVLKRGYIHPERPAPDKWLIQLGADDDLVLARFFALLRPGGKMLVYNICPAPSPPDKPFIPWSDGRSPFSRAQWEKAGFRVLVFDRDDTPAIRVLGRALGWDRDPSDKMDLDHDLSVPSSTRLGLAFMRGLF